MLMSDGRPIPIMRIPEWAIRTDELLPCPFCGGEAFMVECLIKIRPGREIKCTCCAVKMTGAVLRLEGEWLENRMVERWNRRAPAPTSIAAE